MVVVMILDPSSCRKVLDEIVRSSLVEFPFRTSSFSTFFFRLQVSSKWKTGGLWKVLNWMEQLHQPTFNRKKRHEKKHGKTWWSLSLQPFLCSPLGCGSKNFTIKSWDLGPFFLRGFLFWSIPPQKKRCVSVWVSEVNKISKWKTIKKSPGTRHMDPR